MEPGLLTEFPEKADMNGGVIHRIVIDVECLVLLDKIGPFIEVCKHNIEQILSR